MTITPAAFPSFADGLSFHLRLLAAEATAPPDVCQAFLVPLRNYLTSAFPHVDPHLCESAAGNALFDYVKHPTRYDSSRLDLSAYLRMSAKGDLFNALRQEGRHQRSRVPWNVVELGEEAGNLSGSDEEPSVLLQRQEQAAEWQTFLDGFRSTLNPVEQRVLALLLAGERDTSAFAVAMGLEESPLPEQEREVKRMKDRLKKRLQRAAPAFNPGADTDD